MHISMSGTLSAAAYTLKFFINTRIMNNSKILRFLLSLFVLTGTLFFTACSEEGSENVEPDPITETGTASATVEFLDTGEKQQFTGAAIGAIGSGSADTVLMYFSGKNNPMKFILMITPAKKGKHTMGEKDFETYGVFYPDSVATTNILRAYLVGEDNINDNDTEMDGAASFDISSLSNNQIKGSFELTMIKNTTIKEDGEIISGEIKQVKVTNGKFNVPLFNGLSLNEN